MTCIINLTELLQLHTLMTLPNVGLATSAFIDISTTILESISESDFADLDIEFHGQPMNSYVVAFLYLIRNLTKAPVSVDEIFEIPDPIPKTFRKSPYLFLNTVLRIQGQNEIYADELETLLNGLQSQFKSKSVVNV